ncbi:MAG TPA: ATP synthase subunit C [Smithella sp.]|nr:ATP synthase subunit C [Smithella sp.]HOG90233.1 ATP synthase subunit C [Smithella sp.]
MSRNKLLAPCTFAILCCAAGYLFPAVIYAVEGEPAKSGADWMGFAYIGAALAVGLACIGSAYAVARIGSAAIGAVSEKPELTGRTLVFIGLAEGIAIYGLIIAIMILNKL